MKSYLNGRSHSPWLGLHEWMNEWTLKMPRDTRRDIYHIALKRRVTVINVDGWWDERKRNKDERERERYAERKECEYTDFFLLLYLVTATTTFAVYLKRSEREKREERERKKSIHWFKFKISEETVRMIVCILIKSERTTETGKKNKTPREREKTEITFAKQSENNDV